MRALKDILSYAERCPVGDPVPITDSEITILARWCRQQTMKPLSAFYYERVIREGFGKLLGKKLLVLK